MESKRFYGKGSRENQETYSFVRAASKLSRWKFDPRYRQPGRGRRIYITGNKIKKIANNSNPNCPGHIPSADGDLIAGTKRDERNGQRGKERPQRIWARRRRKREERSASARNHSTTLISMHHLDPRTGFSDRFSFRGLHGGSLSGCYLQPPRLRRILATGCSKTIVSVVISIRVR